MTRVLVTGGAGFIGSAVVDQLVEAGHDVRAVDSLHPAAHRRRPGYLNPNAEYHWGDLRDPDVARAAVEGVDAVTHQAAMVGLGVDFTDVVDYVTNNDVSTAMLLRALHDRKFSGRLVLASSMVVYGDGRYSCPVHATVHPRPRTRADLDADNFEVACTHCDRPLHAEPVTEDHPTRPQNVYAATKLHQEHLFSAYGAEHSAPTILLRYHNVYGPRMPRDTPYAGVAAIFRSALAAHQRPRIFEDGQQQRDFIHVRDVATANLLAIHAPTAIQGAFNIASGDTCTILQMANELTAAFGPDAPKPHVVGGYRLGDVRHVFGSAERAAHILGFRARIQHQAGLTDFAHHKQRP